MTKKTAEASSSFPLSRYSRGGLGWGSPLPRAISIASLLLSLQMFSGCGSSPEAQNKNFYTSGNKEADERASQRMAQAEQLSGQGSGDKPLLAPAKKSLYDRLGGDQGITTITEDWVTRMLADPRVNFSRQDVTRGGLTIHRGDSMHWEASDANKKLIKIHIAEFISLASGGPAQYTGREIKEAHTNLHITNDEFDASVGDLKASLDKLQIANTEQKELLAIIESTRDQIVEER
jgi:hemoglobin